METRAARRAKAVIDQLNAEIAASPFRNLKALTAANGWSYGTYLRYTTGEREPKIGVVFEMIDALSIPANVFFMRVQDRFEQDCGILVRPRPSRRHQRIPR